MKTYWILLRDMEPFKHTGNVCIFTDTETVNTTSVDALYINAKEVIYVRSIESDT